MMADDQENREILNLLDGFLVNGQEQEAEEEIELSLGLSSDGRFGMDPISDAKKLKRSSPFSTVDAGGSGVNGASGVAFETYGPLTRTSPLPVDPPEEWQCKKELQTIMRMETRKKSMEKMKNVRIGKHKENFNQSNGVVIGSTAGNGTVNGAIGSKERVSSGIPEFQSLHAEGVTQRAADLKHTSSVPSLPNHIPHRTILGTAVSDDIKETTFKNIILDMPFVSTRGSGPNGTRIEGFLYRYRKRDEVRIVCVCHGNF